MKTILIMAAGNGSRYGTLKQFDELGPCKEFLFEYSIFDALSCGFDHVVLVTKRSHVSELSEYLGARLPERVKLDVLAQELSDLPEGSYYSGARQKPWGTAHAVWTARKVIDGYFVVLNADDYYGARSMKLAAEFMSAVHANSEFGLVPYVLEKTLSTEGPVSRAVCHSERGYLKEITEFKEVFDGPRGLEDLESGVVFGGKEVTSMNFWIFSPLVFSLIESDLSDFVESPAAENGEEIYIPKQVQQWIIKGMVRVRLTEPCEDWFGVTYSKDKSRAVMKLEEKSRTNQYPQPLWSRS